jgi:hypothetical protein
MTSFVPAVQHLNGGIENIRGINMLTKEQLIKEMKELKQERLEDLMKLNAKHDALVEFIANLSYLINEAEGENDGENT